MDERRRQIRERMRDNIRQLDNMARLRSRQTVRQSREGTERQTREHINQLIADGYLREREDEEKYSKRDPLNRIYRRLLRAWNPSVYREMPYDEYLKTEWWQLIREMIFVKRGTSCQYCGARNVLVDIHHLNYGWIGDEFRNQYDLVVLCRECHERQHPERKAREKEQV